MSTLAMPVSRLVPMSRCPVLCSPHSWGKDGSTAMSWASSRRWFGATATTRASPARLRWTVVVARLPAGDDLGEPVGTGAYPREALFPGDVAPLARRRRGGVANEDLAGDRGRLGRADGRREGRGDDGQHRQDGHPRGLAREAWGDGRHRPYRTADPARTVTT